MRMLPPPAAISASLGAALANARATMALRLPMKSTRRATMAIAADTLGREARWKEEAGFFDRWADRLDESKLPIDPLAWKRYTSPRLRPRFNKEFRFLLLGDLRGKTLLDVGCGDSQNVALLAKMGAEVTGLDVSSGAVALARRRAEINGVSDRVHLVCSPIETAEIASRSFDVIWGDGILHHVLDEFENVIQRLAVWAKPGALLLFAEPLNLFPPLRQLRTMIPIETEHTQGERPLIQAEVDLIRKYAPDLSVRHFGFLGRLDPFILTQFNYERSSAIRRAAVNLTNAIDWAMLSVPYLEKLGGSGVLYGHVAG
jgi:2-polyprenyl-3-methyl-5-hydroxy-6-metoxy-1,4-benzoquinol methylase